MNHCHRVDTLLDLLSILFFQMISLQKGSGSGCFYNVDDYLFNWCFKTDPILIEVVSKPKIRSKGPAKRDYISDLKNQGMHQASGRSGKSLFSAYIGM